MNLADTLLLLVSFLLDAGRGFPPDHWVWKTEDTGQKDKLQFTVCSVKIKQKIFGCMDNG